MVIICKIISKFAIISLLLFIMINQIRIQNLRSINDSGFIRLAPIMILLGANSSGKSSFLRSFPLFTQSVDKRLRGPISWFDSSLVDFGDYKTAINKYVTEDEGISFSYGFSVGYRVIHRTIRSYRFDYIDQTELSDGNVSFTLKGDSRGTFVSDIYIQTKNATYKLSAKDRNSSISFELNDELFEFPEKFRFNFDTGFGILPSIESTKSTGNKVNAQEEVFRKLISLLKKHSNKRLQNITRFSTIFHHGNLNKNDFLTELKQGVDLKSFQKNIKYWNINTQEFKLIYNYFLIFKLNSIIDIINNEIATFYHNCDYIAPMRAEAGRYYRIQGLQVQSVDPSGRNLLEFIASLTPKEKNNFDEFVSDILGVTVDAPSESGLKSLRIKNDKGDFSIADVGYGYSQILPVITKLWHTKYNAINYSYGHRLSSNEVSILLMEQPELHLHPAMQAKIADTFIKVINETRKEQQLVSLIIETHSQAIINRIGRRIREKKMQPTDINILLFQKDEAQQNTIINQICYTDKGQLENWPYGFFDPKD